MPKTPKKDAKTPHVVGHAPAKFGVMLPGGGFDPCEPDVVHGAFSAPPPEFARVLVCGGRDFTDAAWVMEKLDAIHDRTPIGAVIHGGAPGADSHAGAWAGRRGIRAEIFRAAWNQYGKSAGPIRNLAMLKVGRPDYVLAFHGGRGTESMGRMALDNGVPLIVMPDRNGDGAWANAWIAEYRRSPP